MWRIMEVFALLACTMRGQRVGGIDKKAQLNARYAPADNVAMLFLASALTSPPSHKIGHHCKLSLKDAARNFVRPLMHSSETSDGHLRSDLLLSARTFTGRRNVMSLVAMLSALPQPAVAQTLVEQGMFDFKQGRVEQSIELFDKIIEKNPASKPYLWQRGLSLYYADRFSDGAEQFAADVAVNPNDTEEFIWNILCNARLDSIEVARQKMIKVGFDRRPYMRAAQTLFEGTSDEKPLQEFTSSRNAADQFYGNLYLGLYREAIGDTQGAREYMTAATKTQYYDKSGDYMADLAKVHMQRRGW